MASSADLSDLTILLVGDDELTEKLDGALAKRGPDIERASAALAMEVIRVAAPDLVVLGPSAGGDGGRAMRDEIQREVGANGEPPLLLVLCSAAMAAQAESFRHDWIGTLDPQLGVAELGETIVKVLKMSASKTQGVQKPRSLRGMIASARRKARSTMVGMPAVQVAGPAGAAAPISPPSAATPAAKAVQVAKPAPAASATRGRAGQEPRGPTPLSALLADPGRAAAVRRESTTRQPAVRLPDKTPPQPAAAAAPRAAPRTKSKLTMPAAVARSVESVGEAAQPPQAAPAPVAPAAKREMTAPEPVTPVAAAKVPAPERGPETEPTAEAAPAKTAPAQVSKTHTRGATFVGMAPPELRAAREAPAEPKVRSEPEAPAPPKPEAPAPLAPFVAAEALGDTPDDEFDFGEDADTIIRPLDVELASLAPSAPEPPAAPAAPEPAAELEPPPPVAPPQVPVPVPDRVAFESLAEPETSQPHMLPAAAPRLPKRSAGEMIAPIVRRMHALRGRLPSASVITRRARALGARGHAGARRLLARRGGSALRGSPALRVPANVQRIGVGAVLVLGLAFTVWAVLGVSSGDSTPRALAAVEISGSLHRAATRVAAADAADDGAPAEPQGKRSPGAGEPEPEADADDDELSDADESDAADDEADGQDLSDERQEALAQANRFVDHGHALLRKRRYGMAEASYLKGLRSWPGFPRALAGLVRVHLARKDGKEAVRWAKQLVRRQPSRGNNQLLLGDAYALRGKKALAKQAWRKAALRFGNPVARKRLNRKR